MKIFPVESLLSATCSFKISESNSIFSPLSQLEKPEPVFNLISKYLIFGFSFNEILRELTFLTILIFSNSPVSKKASII